MTKQITMNVKRDKKGNPESVQFENVSLFYVKLDRPVAVYDQRKMSNPTKTEYTVDIAVTEDIADEWDELFPKQPAKKITNAKFREQYRLEEDDELPVPDAKKQFIIKVKQGSKNKDGSFRKGKARPRVFHVPAGGKPEDITFKTKVANGSVGGLLVKGAYNDKVEAMIAYLNTVKVTELIEYEANNDVSDFLGGDVEIDEEGEENSTERDTHPQVNNPNTDESEDEDEDDEFGGGTTDEEDDEEYN